MKTKHFLITTIIITALVLFFGINVGAEEDLGGRTYIPIRMVSSTSDLIPYTDSTYDLGNTSKRWAEGWFDRVTTTNAVDSALFCISGADCITSWTGGAAAGSGAWLTIWGGTLGATSTANGIYVTGSSTIDILRVLDLRATSSLNYYRNATTTWASFDTNFNRNYNATSTRSGFIQDWITAYNATSTRSGFIQDWDAALIATSTWSGDLLVDGNSTTTGFQYIGNSLTIGTDLLVSGDTSLVNATTSGSHYIGVASTTELWVSGNGRFGGTLDILGLSTFTGDVLFNGAATTTKQFSGISPTEPSHFVTLEYHELDSDSSFDFYFTTTTSDIDDYGVETNLMQDTASDNDEATVVFSTVSPDTDDQLIAVFAIASSTLPFTDLAAGTITVHFHAYQTTGNDDLKTYFTIVQRDASQSETILATSELSELITSKAAVSIHASISTETDFVSTDRLLIKVYANSDDNAPTADAELTIYAQGANSSRVTVKTPSDVFSNIFVRQDGTTPLTSSWNANNGITMTLSTSTNSTSTNLYISNSLTVASDTSLANATSTFFYASGDITAGGSFYGDGSKLTGVSGTGITNLNSETLGSIGDVSTSTIAYGSTLTWDTSNWVSTSTIYGFSEDWTALANATTTWSGFTESWVTLANATNTWSGFTESWNTLANATNTWSGYTDSWITLFNATSTFGGNSQTATALASNGGNCAAGSYALGVDEDGKVETCTDASTEIDSIVATHLAVVTDTNTIGHLNDTDWDTFNNKVSQDSELTNWIDNVVLGTNGDLETEGYASSTTGLFTQGAGHYGGALTIDSTLNVIGAITGALTGNASTATASADNPTDCAAGSYPLGVDANWDVENCTDATTEINSVVNGLGGTNLTCSGQSCSVDDDFLKLGGDIASAGAYDFGSASVVFEIPQDGTVDATGEFQLHVASSSIEVYDGSKVAVIPSFQSFSFTIASTTFRNYPIIPIKAHKDAITITDIHCQVVTATDQDIFISDGTDDAETIVCDTSGAEDDGSIANGTFDAREMMYVEMGTAAGDPDWLNVTITFTINN